MKFAPPEDRIFDLFDPDFCQYHAEEEPFVMLDEKQTTEIQVVSAFPCFHIPDLDHKWQSEKLFPFIKKKYRPTKCADHMVFLYDKEKSAWIVHIFEMKTGIGVRTWQKVRLQLSGALCRAYTIGGVLLYNHGFSQIYTHCVYKDDRPDQELIELEAEADGLIEKPQEREADHTPEWELPSVKLPLFPEMELPNTPIKLDFTIRKKGRVTAEIRLDTNGCSILSPQ